MNVASRNRVVKLSYKYKGPFIGQVMLGHGCYMLQIWKREDTSL
jgi:hypothetical protein